MDRSQFFYLLFMVAIVFVLGAAFIYALEGMLIRRVEAMMPVMPSVGWWV